ncbi:CopG family transcriptional regulator [Anaerofustis stercorihominis]|uniref:CopG family transcriptional regulator n=1 Tax=Anaerofustis stercorihominis TaxID=214853 RepID=UPI0026723ABF|nr:CopG family transcriptional regulator [Anaerofustis stercorihominis]
MAKKMGRPTQDPKDYQMRIRLGSKEKERLEYCSEYLNISKSDVIRQGIDEVYNKIKK